jgi:hypothetical protein
MLNVRVCIPCWSWFELRLQLKASFFCLFFGRGETKSTWYVGHYMAYCTQPRMIDDDECGAVGGKRIGRENRSIRRKLASVPLCSPQIPHDVT